MRGLGPFLKDAWRLARPYFMTSEEKWAARGILAAIVAMNLTLVGVTSYSATGGASSTTRYRTRTLRVPGTLFLYRQTESGLMPGFCEVAAVLIILAVYRST